MRMRHVFPAENGGWFADRLVRSGCTSWNVGKLMVEKNKI